MLCTWEGWGGGREWGLLNLAIGRTQTDVKRRKRHWITAKDLTVVKQAQKTAKCNYCYLNMTTKGNNPKSPLIGTFSKCGDELNNLSMCALINCYKNTFFKFEAYVIVWLGILVLQLVTLKMY